MARLRSLCQLQGRQHCVCRELQAPGCDWVPIEVQLGARVLPQATSVKGRCLKCKGKWLEQAGCTYWTLLMQRQVGMHALKVPSLAMSGSSQATSHALCTCDVAWQLCRCTPQLLPDRLSVCTKTRPCMRAVSTTSNSGRTQVMMILEARWQRPVLSTKS